MKKTFIRILPAMALAVFLCLCRIGAAPAEDTFYTENEWNFVDQSMDPRNGIPEDAAGVLDRIRRTGVLRVATEPYFAPQEFIDPDLQGQEQYAGADMVLARLIAERMGVELEIIPMDFSDVLPALAEDRCDLTISALAYTPSRAGSYTMSKGYYFTDSVANTAVMIRESDADAILTVEDLKGRILIAQRGSLQEAQAARNVTAYTEFRRVSTVEDVYEAIRDGRADAGFVDMETAQKYIDNNPDAGLMLVVGLHFNLEDYEKGDRICAKKGETQLICFVNGVIDEVLADGSYMQWIKTAEKRAAELGY